MTVFQLSPQPVHKTLNDCLRNLSVALSDLAETALAEVPLAGEAKARGTALSFDACVKAGDTIINSLLIANGSAKGEYVLVGDLQPGGDSSKPSLLENFKPTTSLELFQLLGHLYAYAAVPNKPKGLKVAGEEDPVTIAEAILVRSLTLADSIAFVFRAVESDLLVQIIKNFPGGQEKLNQLTKNYANSVRKHARMVGAFIRDQKAADKLTQGCMINLPACVTFAVEPEQRCINGMYFPRELEKSLIKKLVATQARTISDRG